MSRRSCRRTSAASNDGSRPWAAGRWIRASARGCGHADCSGCQRSGPVTGVIISRDSSRPSRLSSVSWLSLRFPILLTADDTDAECRKPARGRSSSVNSVSSVLKTPSPFQLSAFQPLPSASVDRPSCLCAFVVKTPVPWFRSPTPILLTTDFTDDADAQPDQSHHKGTETQRSDQSAVSSFSLPPFLSHPRHPRNPCLPKALRRQARSNSVLRFQLCLPSSVTSVLKTPGPFQPSGFRSPVSVFSFSVFQRFACRPPLPSVR